AKSHAAKDKAWEERVKLIEKFQAQMNKAPKGAKVTDAYSTSAFRLLADKEVCLKCHPIGNIKIEGAQGPNLALSAERLRPEWTEQWIANPLRMFPYSPAMPQNFPNDPDPLKWKEQDKFVGKPLQQTRAVRDLLMDLPRLNDLITSNPPVPAA